MNDEYEAELKIALEKGFISPGDVSGLREEARSQDRSPLVLLQERGLISEETLAVIRESRPGKSAKSKSSPSEADTLKPGRARREGASADEAFPVPGWERYHFVKLLGQGGMGQVFLAYDPRLRRNVALKFVRGKDTEFVRRLVSEARNQARVEHPRVCHVHEVGEVQGLPYIAMHYVDGQPLGHFIDKLTVKQKAALLRGAAEGIHAAHSVGLIHRDIKPSNILVEETEDGRLQPYVVDFGLARDSHERGTTATGSVIGTPYYMAPEQARGEGERLDWRADVYSLGATLYHLLTGKLPIPGENSLKVLSNIATVEPRPPRALDPQIPKDLEAIVLKCLEKERSARYDSVLALIEDLDRFLAGEPVKARSTGLGYRLYKKARKHQRLVAVAAVALLAVASALGWGLYEGWKADQREKFARSFTEKVERIESRARLSALAPLHDTRKDRAALRERLEALEAEIRDAGALAAGPGYYALGRGYLALGEDDKAREQLEKAWGEGFREPRVASALALVLSRLYRQQRLEAARLAIIQTSAGEPKPQGGGVQPGLDKQKLEKLYREPALEYLNLSKGAEELSPAWVEALFAFYDEQFDTALARLDTIEASEAWSYEVLQLRGDILRVRAARRMSEGDFAGAREDLAAGRQAYAAAAEIGRSELAIPLAQAELELTELIVELYSSGKLQESFSRGLEAVARARGIAPDSAEALLLEAHLHRRLSEHKVNQRNDAEAGALLQKARTLAEEALRLNPRSSRARIELAQGHVLEGRGLAQAGKDPRDHLRQALMHFEQVSQEDRNAEFEVYVGRLLSTWAGYEANTGGEPLPYLNKAIDSYHRAIQHDGALLMAWLNLGKAYLAREPRLGNPDPDGDLKKARDALVQALALGPEDILVYYYTGRLYEREASRAHARGADARVDWSKARKQYERAISINSKAAYLHDRLGFILLELAREEGMRGGDPFPLLDQAQASYERAFAVSPDFFTARMNVSDALVQRALYQRARGESPEASLRSALAALASASKPLEALPQLWGNLGAAHVLMAGFELDQGRNPSQSLSRAEEALHRALEMGKDDAQPWLYRGQLRGLQARWRVHQGRGQIQDDDFKQAASDFQDAIKLAARTHDVREPEYRLAFGQFCCAWASWQRRKGGGSKEALKLGLEQMQTVLGVRPGMPDALKLRDCLTRLEKGG